ncbi:MAG: FAD-dependent oxidoreductase [Kofleriaceae bacterium]|nr:FAD-dependent oxidoreductase [Kofleriaceae bacterium]
MHAPRYKRMNASYWQRDANWRDQWRETRLPARADVVVIGGGYSGLATAIALRQRDPGAEIVLLEAERVGFGASGRNAGFLSPLAAPVWLLAAYRSPDHAWAAAQINREMHAAARWIGAHLEDVELQPTPLYLMAELGLASTALDEFETALGHTNLPFDQRMDRSSSKRVLVMDAYTVHPYKLVRALAHHAAALGVRIRERARVQTVAPVATGARVRLEDGGEVSARTVVVCTNAYTSSLDIGERVRAITLHSFMLASTPTTTPPGPPWFTVEVNRDQTFHRMHGDRLLYGGIDQVLAPKGTEFALPRAVQERLIANLGRSLPGHAITPAEGWSGKFHATANGLPMIHRSTKNPAVVINVGYGGTGVALALTCGKLAAAVASDDRYASTDEERLHTVIRDTRISVRDAARAGLGILRSFLR